MKNHKSLSQDSLSATISHIALLLYEDLQASDLSLSVRTALISSDS